MSGIRGVQIARGRESQRKALESLYDTGENDLEEQGRYDLALRFQNELEKRVDESYTHAKLSKNRYFVIRKNSGVVPASKATGRPTGLISQQIKLVQELIGAQKLRRK